MERKREEQQESGEIETAHLGYLGSQDTFYVGNMKGVGRICQQTFVDTYAKVAFAKHRPAREERLIAASVRMPALPQPSKRDSEDDPAATGLACSGHGLPLGMHGAADLLCCIDGRMDACTGSAQQRSDVIVRRFFVVIAVLCAPLQSLPTRGSAKR